MKPDKIAVITIAAAFAVSGLGWAMIPVLQSAQRTVDTEAALHVERARRLLDHYSAQLHYSSLLLDQLRDADVDVDVEDPEDIVEYFGDFYQERHEALWASFEPKEWDPDQPRAALARYGDLARQIRDGVQARAQLTDENAGLLDAALAAVNEALATESGDASAAADPEANRLKAVILYHQGLAERVRATLKHSEASDYRGKLLQLARRASRLGSSLVLVAGSGIEARIAALSQAADESQRRIGGLQTELSRIDATITQLETRLTTATNQGESARVAIEQLHKDGIDFSNEYGAERFTQQLLEQSRTYRRALREAHVIEVGGYANAEIDASGDYLRGRYLENGTAGNLTLTFGLVHHRHERNILAETIEREALALADLNSDRDRLVGIRDAYGASEADARRRVDEIQPLVADVYAELNRVESEAEVAEDEALDLLNESARLFQQASNHARRWIDDARELTQAMSPEAKQRSAFEKRTGDAWMGAHIAVQVADARLAKAWIHYERFRAAEQNADALTAASETVTLAEADPEQQRMRAIEARDAGVEEITQAMSVLEKAHRNLGRHWTLAAQGASTTYLLALFGQSSYVADAVEGYRNAIKGRENETFARKFVDRLRQLESR
ncbi:MAG: hypothetical protein IID35_07085 [Planctomycetes bacterium]|nr:hypothetical protein [Planctomycetota bacterium]